jgi:spore coat protein A
MQMVSRRRVLAFGAVTGAGLLVPWGASEALTAPVPGGSLDPTTVPKYVSPLFVLPAMPRDGTAAGGTVDWYSIGMRQFRQQMLPPGLPRTTVWGYGSTSYAGTFHTPGYTLEATTGRPLRAGWANQLVDNSGGYLPHLLPVDQTLHWANPPGGVTGRDGHPVFTSTPGRYLGPVPTVVHLHGAHADEESDGYPQAWFLPAARNLPSGYATNGSFYNQFAAEAKQRNGLVWSAGNSVYQYRNDQRAGTLWYHDHVLGMTRLNIQAGLAGFYLLRGGSSDLPAGVLPGPAPARGDPAGVAYHEIPMVVQDRSFNTDGSLFFPASRDFFGDAPAGGPFIPTSDVPPIWNPEFFGATMVVNGRTWPALTVEPRRYRFRILNACNARTLILKVALDPLVARPAPVAVQFWQIGSDAGFLPRPVKLDQLLIGPSERADVILDLTGQPAGTQLYLINEGPDMPYGGGTIDEDFAPADPGTTGQVMKFVVGALKGPDTSVPPGQLALPPLGRLGAAGTVRQVSLNELDSVSFPDAEAPIVGALGTLDSRGNGVPLMWDDQLTETPSLGGTEIWEITNTTEDGHPIHVHQVQFEVVNRENADGVQRGPQPWEIGTKDTLIALPGETTRLKAHFDLPGRFVWHCHILDHEDNEMMRPYQVG